MAEFQSEHRCRRCGRVKRGRNAVERISRGRTYLSCRRCVNRYMRRYMREWKARG